MSNQFQVVVAGSGITGLSSALHLAEMGAPKVIVTSSHSAPTSARAPGLLTGGQRDNFTRVATAHQPDFAAQLWKFGDQAFDRLLSWSRSHGVEIATTRRLRLIAAPEEFREAREAVSLMSAAGIETKLIHGSELRKSHWGAALGDRILAVQDDGTRGGWVDTGSLYAALLAAARRHPAISFARGPVETVSGYAGPDLELVIDNQTVTADALIVACHLATGDLIPSLKTALISCADQWMTVAGTLAPCDGADRDAPGWGNPGIVWSAFHNHEWGVTMPGGRVLLGGGRILRKWAGFEAVTAEPEERITKYIWEQAIKTFPGLATSQGRYLATAAGLDCHPCDELPVIGPMYGEGRILVAAGFMGQGITLGFEAGFCLAKLLMTGQCPELPRRLWPERLRSLPDPE